MWLSKDESTIHVRNVGETRKKNTASAVILEPSLTHVRSSSARATQKENMKKITGTCANLALCVCKRVMIYDDDCQNVYMRESESGREKETKQKVIRMHDPIMLIFAVTTRSTHTVDEGTGFDVRRQKNCY